MATIDEVLAAMPEAAAEAAYEYLTIDPTTRRIIVPEAEEIFGVEGDGRAERKYFMCPRYVGDNLDLATCFLEVIYRNANGETDRYLVEDLAATSDTVTFSWELTSKVTAYKGQIQFKVHADNGAGRDWGTTLATGTSLEGLEPEAVDVEAETSDQVTQLRAMVTAQTGAVEACGAAQVQAVEAAAAEGTADAQAQIEAKGEAVRASIPEDYTTLANTVDRLTHDRAAAIVCGAEGETVQVTDASADPLQGLRIFGRSTQAGDPTPDNPVDIVSLAAPVVSVYGENIFDVSKMDAHANKALDVADDGATIAATGGGDKPYTSSVLQLDVAALRGNTLIMTADSIANTNPAAKGGVQLNVHRGEGRDYEAISAESLTRSLYIGADVTDLYITIYTNNTANALGADNVVTVKGLRLNLNKQAAWSKCAARQSLTVITPDGLPGIPVESCGNYTDAAGQQWIADEVDLARGVYVQRVGRLVLDGSAKWNAYNYETTYYGFHIWDLLDEYHSRSPGMCNQFETVGGSSGDCIWVGASNANVYAISKEWYDRGLDAWKEHLNAKPLAIIYARVTPVETALTTEELQAFRALHSNKPTTTVLNDAGAWMAVEYAADPKLYIDRKIAELVAANNT